MRENAGDMSEQKEIPVIVCRNCALRLARLASQRHWWFGWLRAPLVWGMRLLAFCNGIDARRHPVRHSECRGCIRFMKAELEEKSPTFRFLNAIVGKPFSALRDGLLTASELAEAKRFAAESMLPASGAAVLANSPEPKGAA